MRTFYQFTLTFLLISSSMYAQETTSQRIAYSYLYANFEKAIVEQLDDSKLSSKEEKLFVKFMKQLNRECIVNFESYLSQKLEELDYKVQPLNSVGVMGKSAINLDGYPLILLPKRTLKKHADKDVADTYISASLSISKPIVAVVGMKPTIGVTLKLFNQQGEQLQKVTSSQKTEKKVSNLGFAFNQKESFSKIDKDHAQILYEKVEEAIKLAIDDAISQLGKTE